MCHGLVRFQARQTKSKRTSNILDASLLRGCELIRSSSVERKAESVQEIALACLHSEPVSKLQSSQALHSKRPRTRVHKGSQKCFGYWGPVLPRGNHTSTWREHVEGLRHPDRAAAVRFCHSASLMTSRCGPPKNVWLGLTVGLLENFQQHLLGPDDNLAAKRILEAYLCGAISGTRYIMGSTVYSQHGCTQVLEASCQ